MIREILRGGGIERPLWEARQIEASGRPEPEQGDMARRRAAGEPLAYVLGEWDFYGLTLKVTPDVLIPRPDTETLVDRALPALRGRPGEPDVLDLCCGSGCIGLAIAHECPAARVTLADFSDRALAVARENSQNFQNIAVCCCSALEKPPGIWANGFDLIACNPPYIAENEWAALPRPVAAYEPRMALHGGADGLDFYRAIAEKWHSALRPGGHLLLEVGYRQADAVSGILRRQGFYEIQVVKDAAGHDRVVTCRGGA